MTLGDDALRSTLAAHVHDLIALAVGAVRDVREAAAGRGLRAAKRHAIRQDIVLSLDHPGLSVGTVARRHACTERFVQRLFEAEGTTFTAFLLAQRLERAYRRLADPRRAGEKVSVV